MPIPRWLLVSALLVCAAGFSQARSVLRSAVPPALAAGVVKRYFDAFRHQDAGRLADVTAGPAAVKTRRMLDTIRDEARRHDVGVELKVKDLRIAPAQPGPTATPVEARFDIAVVAKKWPFSKEARSITGRAIFYVGKNLGQGDTTGAKIVGLTLRFD